MVINVYFSPRQIYTCGAKGQDINDRRKVQTVSTVVYSGGYMIIQPYSLRAF